MWKFMIILRFHKYFRAALVILLISLWPPGCHIARVGYQPVLKLGAAASFATWRCDSTHPPAIVSTAAGEIRARGPHVTALHAWGCVSVFCADKRRVCIVAGPRPAGDPVQAAVWDGWHGRAPPSGESLGGVHQWAGLPQQVSAAARERKCESRHAT